MSIIGGLVDTHHEMELTPSAQLLARSWLIRHLWTVVAAGMVALGSTAAWLLGLEP
jgi:hypothetical protein